MKVRIYRPSKSSSQSGRAGMHLWWLIEPEAVSARTPEPLMGWTSADDTFSEMRNRLKFHTAEEAMAFAQKKGWEFTVEEAAERRIIPRNYMDNFRLVRPEDEELKPPAGA